jgi:ketol-acid reductoisomerase
MEKRITIIGYGNQGKAWAANLKDNGFDIRIALRNNSASIKLAQNSNFNVISFDKLKDSAEIFAILIPDDAQAQFINTYKNEFSPNSSLIFACGFTIAYNLVELPKYLNTILVAPKGIGEKLRENFLNNSGVPALIGVENDYTKTAWEIATEIATSLGCGRIGIYKSSFKEEVEADLFSEQVLLCGGVPFLLLASYETMLKAGFGKEASFFECVHELKLIVDMIYKDGIYGMYKKISSLARFGGLKTGNFLIDDNFKTKMNIVLDKIKSKEFLKDYLDKENNKNTNMLLEELKNNTLDQIWKKMHSQ